MHHTCINMNLLPKLTDFGNEMQHPIERIGDHAGERLRPAACARAAIPALFAIVRLSLIVSLSAVVLGGADRHAARRR